MRHSKWLIVLYSLCFVAMAVLLCQSLFSVSDVVIDYSVYNDSNTKEMAEILQEYKGTNLLFLKTEDVKKQITDNTLFKVENIKKVYPNKLYITLKSSRERFAVKMENGYAILDDEYIVCDIREDLNNSSDNLKNIVIDFEKERENFANLQVKSSLTFSNPQVLDALKTIVSVMDSPRDFIHSIRIEEREKDSNYYIYLTTIEGVEIEIRKALSNPKAKTLAGIEKYQSLSDSDRLVAKIAVYEERDSGDVVATFTKR